MPYRTRLPRFTPTVNVDHNIKFCKIPGQLERLTNHHAAGFTRKELVDRLVIDSNQTFARFDEHPRYSTFAATGTITVIFAHISSPDFELTRLLRRVRVRSTGINLEFF